MSLSLTLALALLAGLAPAIPVSRITDTATDRARDGWLFVLAWIGVAALAWHLLALGLMAAAVLLHWRGPEQTPAVAVWAGIAASWLLVDHIPPLGLTGLTLVWRAIAVAQIVLALWQFHRGQLARGTVAQRTLLAGLLALVWPFSSPWEWPAYALGFGITGSWIAGVALALAVAVRYPASWPWVAGSLGLLGVALAVPALRWPIDRRIRRGGSLKSLRHRWATWTTALRLMAWPIWLVGRGPGSRSGLCSMRLDMAAETLRTRRLLAWTNLHCEPLELAYQYGLLAVLAMGALCWHLWPRLAFGDPWSAAVVAGLVLACGSIPARVAPVGLTWLVALAVVAAR